MNQDSSHVTTATRAVVVHYHLFKNAGSSIDAALKAYFGSRWCAMDHGEKPGHVYSHKDVSDFIRSRPEIACVSSHQLRPPLRSPAVNIYPILMLRHPLDRIGSIYRFERKRGQRRNRKRPLARMAACSRFRKFVEWALAKGL